MNDYPFQNVEFLFFVGVLSDVLFDAFPYPLREDDELFVRFFEARVPNPDFLFILI